MFHAELCWSCELKIKEEKLKTATVATCKKLVITWQDSDDSYRKTVMVEQSSSWSSCCWTFLTESSETGTWVCQRPWRPSPLWPPDRTTRVRQDVEDQGGRELQLLNTRMLLWGSITILIFVILSIVNRASDHQVVKTLLVWKANTWFSTKLTRKLQTLDRFDCCSWVSLICFDWIICNNLLLL